VEGNDKRLAIECDGDRDLPPEKLHDDVERQSMLERLGWTFARVRGSTFFREPERAIKPIIDKLESLEIPVNSPALDRADGSPSLGELTERVTRRAEELREEWSAPRDKRRLRSQPSDSLP
jgi:predicted RNA binding protein YcfA (HicA-like mRNA interferase family)